jgi:type II secretory pathway component PulM
MFLLRVGMRGAGRRPAGRQGKWSWQARLILLGIIVAVAAQWPAGRVALAIIGGGVVFVVLAIVVLAFGKPATKRKGPFEEYLEQQEGAKR